MNSAIIENIRHALPGLSKSERRVGDWILANSRLAVDLSINDVAARAEVSDPTVIRFCRTMGLSGYRELRTHLIAALQKPQSYLHHDVSPQDEPSDAAIKVLESSVQALVELRELISQMPFDAAIRRLRPARQIIFAGLGASGCVASDAMHKFFRLGIPCTTALDAQTILQQAAIASEDDVFIAISHTGKWQEMVRGMQLAIDRGGSVLAVTDRRSLLGQTADLTFHCHPAEDTNVFTPMSSRLAQLTILDALQVNLAIAVGPDAEHNLQLSKEALAQSPERR
jgi:RpiR family carbohydrate utilization transcriptional regulator